MDALIFVGNEWMPLYLSDLIMYGWSIYLSDSINDGWLKRLPMWEADADLSDWPATFHTCVMVSSDKKDGLCNLY